VLTTLDTLAARTPTTLRSDRDLLALEHLFHEVRKVVGASTVDFAHLGCYSSIYLTFGRRYHSCGIPGWGGYANEAAILVAVHPDGVVRIWSWVRGPWVDGRQTEYATETTTTSAELLATLRQGRP
jgi:hypothetical protein